MHGNLLEVNRKKEVTHRRRKYRSGKRPERTESEKAVGTTETAKKESEKKNNCGKRQGSFEGYGRKVRKKTEKPRKTLQKLEEEPEKVQL